MIKTAPRITDTAGLFYRQYHSSLNGGLEYVLNAWPAMYKQALGDLQERLTQDELSLIINVCCPTLLTPGIAGHQLMIQVMLGIDLYHVDQEWNVDRDEILQKITDMTIFECAVLEIWAAAGGPGHDDDIEG